MEKGKLKDNNLKITKKINIGYKKVCNCPKNHINCLDAKTWLKSQLGVWQFYYEKRDIRKKMFIQLLFLFH